MVEITAYAVLLIGVPFLCPLWIGWRVFRFVRRNYENVVAAVVAALGFAAASFVVLGYVGFIGALFLGCALHKYDPECEYIAQDTLFGKFQSF